MRLNSQLQLPSNFLLFFFFNDTATTEIYTLSLHDALPILHIKFFQRLVGWRELRMPLGPPRRARRMRYLLPSDREGDKFLFPNPLSPMWDVCLIANGAVLNFKFCWCRAHVDDLVGHLHELTKIERTIIERAGQ